MNLPVKVYTEKEVQRARRNSKVVGWIQGGGAVLAGGFLLNLLGWVPALLVVVVVGFVVYKLFSSRSADGEE